MAMIESAIRAVCDAGPVIHLDELNCLDLLGDFQEILLVDSVDASARLVAEQMGFKVHGTIGIIIRSIRRGQMKPEQVLRILKEIPLKTTLHIKASLLEEIILKIKREFKL